MNYILGSCKEHLEIVIDEFVDEVEQAPDIIHIGDFTGPEEKRPTGCMFCGKEVDFVLFK
jgi:CxxH/CxxC protein (TIGR04129 family)